MGMPEKEPEMSVLFVCAGNICRSPAAEGVFKELLRQHGLDQRVAVDSAGTDAYHQGESPDSRMAAAAAARGYTLEGKARRIRLEDLDRFDFVLTMDEANHSDVLALPSAEYFPEKVQPLMSYSREFTVRDVPDPYYGGRNSFERVLDLVEDACEGFLESEILPKLST